MKVNRELIYDVGMHTGEDTAFYLKKGFKVIAFEANPDLIDLCKKKFSKEITEGNLTIVEGAIVTSNKIREKTIKFYKNEDLSVWSTVVEEFSARYEELGANSTIIEVPTIDFVKCLEEYGIPYYLKIDIEGMDIVCLKSLLPFPTKPAYVSIEAEKLDFDELQNEFNLLERLGYDQFQIINQADVSSLNEPKDSIEGKYVNHSFEMGASGLFGSDITKPWFAKKTALKKYKWIFLGYLFWGDTSTMRKYWIIEFFRKIFSLTTRRPMHSIPGWFDTHARHSSLN